MMLKQRKLHDLPEFQHVVSKSGALQKDLISPTMAAVCLALAERAA